jgi:hypothetical protein
MVGVVGVVEALTLFLLIKLLVFELVVFWFKVFWLLFELDVLLMLVGFSGGGVGSWLGRSSFAV